VKTDELQARATDNRNLLQQVGQLKEEITLLKEMKKNMAGKVNELTVMKDSLTSKVRDLEGTVK
jgi:hypothetical protein